MMFECGVDDVGNQVWGQVFGCDGAVIVFGGYAGCERVIW